MMQKENTNRIVKTIAKCLDVPLDDVNISTWQGRRQRKMGGGNKKLKPIVISSV